MIMYFLSKIYIQYLQVLNLNTYIGYLYISSCYVKKKKGKAKEKERRREKVGGKGSDLVIVDVRIIVHNIYKMYHPGM